MGLEKRIVNGRAIMSDPEARKRAAEAATAGTSGVRDHAAKELQKAKDDLFGPAPSTTVKRFPKKTDIEKTG